MVTSQFPDRFVKNLNGYYNGIDLTINANKEFIDKLKAMNIYYLVLRPFYKLEGKNLLVVRKFKMWNIYKVP
jgi:hypothetical protein